MTPEEKAKELYNRFIDLEPKYDFEIYAINDCLAKQCALITIEEVLSEATQGYYYWQDVKKEIEKL